MDLDKIYAMGGYGWYVWTAYGITLAVFGINVIVYFGEKRQLKKRIMQYWSRQKLNP